MHPAPSLIAFTVLSGAGYGLLIVLGLLAASGAADGAWLGGVGIGMALVLVSTGLLASMGHLGHPERAWRALSQWRTSWLSREGVAAGLTYLPVLGLGALWVLDGTPHRMLAVIVVLCSLATVFCTAMIYGSLKPIARWHNPWVPVAFSALSVATGASWTWFAWTLARGPSTAIAALAGAGAIIGWSVRLLGWRAIDRQVSPATAGTATGLGRFGKVRLIEPPHHGENYLLKEMGFRVARKHAAKLRVVAALAGAAVPLAASLLAAILPHPIAASLLALLSVIGAMTGALVERWLFFAEARHTVGLYYGAQAA